MAGSETLDDIRALLRHVISEQEFVSGERPVPGFAAVYNGQGDPSGVLIAWVDGGFLAALEYSRVTDEPPQALPAIDQVRLGKP